MHQASYSLSFVAPVEGSCSWTMVFIKPFIVALFAVVLLGLVVDLLLVLDKLCFDAGSSPSVTSAPDREII